MTQWGLSKCRQVNADSKPAKYEEQWTDGWEGNSAKSVPKENDMVCLNGNQSCVMGTGQVKGGSYEICLKRGLS